MSTTALPARALTVILVVMVIVAVWMTSAAAEPCADTKVDGEPALVSEVGGHLRARGITIADDGAQCTVLVVTVSQTDTGFEVTISGVGGAETREVTSLATTAVLVESTLWPSNMEVELTPPDTARTTGADTTPETEAPSAVRSGTSGTVVEAASRPEERAAIGVQLRAFGSVGLTDDGRWLGGGTGLCVVFGRVCVGVDVSHHVDPADPGTRELHYTSASDVLLTVELGWWVSNLDVTLAGGFGMGSLTLEGDGAGDIVSDSTNSLRVRLGGHVAVPVGHRVSLDLGVSGNLSLDEEEEVFREGPVLPPATWPLIQTTLGFRWSSM